MSSADATPPKRAKRELPTEVFVVGQRISIPGKDGALGCTRFVGQTSFMDGTWVGVELDAPIGKHDGTVDGVRYFSCKPLHGLMLRPERARLADLTLNDFPPMQSRVLTPRTDREPTFETVIRHKPSERALVVMPRKDNVPTSLALSKINDLHKKGQCVVQYLAMPAVEDVETPVKAEAQDQEAEAEAEETQVGVQQVKAEDTQAEPQEAKAEDEVDAKADDKVEGAGTDAEVKDELHATLSEPVNAKLEEQDKAAKDGWEVRKTDDKTRALEEIRAKYLADPQGKPRRVFRGACHPRSIVQVLHGEARLFRKNEHADVYDAHGNLLIRQGEIYICADSAFNTFAPSYAGDDNGALRHVEHLRGMAREMKEKYGRDEEQSEFIFFRRCTRAQEELPYSAWHGKAAAGGFLLAGKYSIDDDVVQYIHFNELPECTQWASACWHTKYEAASAETLLKKFQCEVCTACKADFANAPDCQNQATATKDGRFLGYGQPRGARSTIAGFTFESYPEELYAELVRIGADNGQVSVDNDLGPHGLGPLTAI